MSDKTKTAQPISPDRMIRRVTCANLEITVEAEPNVTEGEIQGLINDTLGDVAIERTRWTTFGKLHITGKVTNIPSPL